MVIFVWWVMHFVAEGVSGRSVSFRTFAINHERCRRGAFFVTACMKPEVRTSGCGAGLVWYCVCKYRQFFGNADSGADFLQNAAADASGEIPSRKVGRAELVCCGYSVDFQRCNLINILPNLINKFICWKIAKMPVKPSLPTVLYYRDGNRK